MRCLRSAEAEAPPPKAKNPGKNKIDPTSSAGAIEAEQGGIAGALDPSPNCKSGFVWRVSRPEDLVCVTPEARTRTAQENRRAAERRDPAGAYGPDTCLSGYVWREAFEGDLVCVPPEIRDLVRKENQLADSRRVGG